MKVVAYPFLAASALALVATAQAQKPAPTLSVVTDELPPGPGHELVAKTCTGCHTAGQVAAERLSREEWRAMVVKMIGFGAEVPADKEAQIVEYLTRTFPAAK